MAPLTSPCASPGPSRGNSGVTGGGGQPYLCPPANLCACRDLGKGGTVEHTFDKHTTDLQPGAPERMELAQLLQGTRDAPV